MEQETGNPFEVSPEEPTGNRFTLPCGTWLVTKYPVHSYILFTIPVGRSDKLVPRHRGPYQVMSHAGAVYIIQDLVNYKVMVTHIHNLRPLNYDAECTDPVPMNLSSSKSWPSLTFATMVQDLLDDNSWSPVAVAQQSAQEFVIEQVLNHRGKG